jgi:hypothetical protein
LVEICIGECQASLQRHVRHSPGAGAPVLLEAAETRDEGAEPSVRDGGGGKGDPDAVAVEGSRAREEGVVADGRVCRVGAARMEEPAACRRRRRRRRRRLRHIRCPRCACRYG